MLKRLTITIPDRLSSELDRLRLAEQVSLSSVAEVALRAFLQNRAMGEAASLRAAGASRRRRPHRRRKSGPALEAHRLSVLHNYRILDTPPDGTYDKFTELAAKIFCVPIALVTVVDEDRIWFKSRYGLTGIQQIPRDPGLCSSVICTDDVYIVESARTDIRTLSNPLVASSFGLQFYAAAPLVTHEGFRLGTFCIIDRKPRQMSDAETQLLQTLAALVMYDLELRMQAMALVAVERQRVDEDAFKA